MPNEKALEPDSIKKIRYSPLFQQQFFQILSIIKVYKDKNRSMMSNCSSCSGEWIRPLASRL